jgi:GT2 family glycosyltransferase
MVRLTHNKGPAAARNVAVKKAKGTILVFFDADVTVYPDTLAKIAGKFKEDHDLTAVTGVWDKHQRTKSFFPQFKAMRDWSYWINERDRDGYYYLFSTRNAAIRRDVFTRLGGFNEAFRQMEDVEFTYRIAKRYAIIFAPDVRVHHEFEEFWPVARKYFWRSFYWTKLYKVRKKFDPVATTMSETVTAITGVGAIGVIVAGTIVYFLLPFTWIRIATVTTVTILFLIHLFLLRKFLWFLYKEKGFGFVCKAVGIGLVLYSVIFAGSAYYQVKKNI